MGWVEVQPRCEPIFHVYGWSSTTAFLAWTGILVNRHRDRQVESVSLDEHSFFVKKQLAVTWRERLLNAWHGFGLCSTAVREAKLLLALHEAGIGCPEVAAHGENGRQAFVLLKAATGMTELRCVLQQIRCDTDRQEWAVALGRELARLHDAGFDHPDLFAKHILVSRQGSTFRFCFLDWQRGRHRRRVPWRLRCRDLAVLDATLSELLASNRLRLRCLRAYLKELKTSRNAPPLPWLAQRLRRETEALRKKRNVRELAQLPIPEKQQQFVSLCEGRLLIVRSHYENLPGSEEFLPSPGNPGEGSGVRAEFLPSPGNPGEGSGVRAEFLPSPGNPGEGSGVRAEFLPSPGNPGEGRNSNGPLVGSSPPGTYSLSPAPLRRAGFAIACCCLHAIGCLFALHTGVNHTP